MNDQRQIKENDDFVRELSRVPAVANLVWLTSLDRSLALAGTRERQLALEMIRRRARSGADGAQLRRDAARLGEQRADSDRRRREIATSEIGQTRLKPGHLAVLGHVFDPEGRPLAGLSVVVSDEKEGRKRKPFGEITTDAAGTYVVQGPADQYRRYFESSSQLVVKVTGGAQDVHHVLLKTLSQEERARSQVVDVHLPPEAFRIPAPVAKSTSQASLLDVKGLGPRRVEKLGQEGVRDLAGLAASDPASLSRWLRISNEQAEEIVAAARRHAG